jgi:hypothetical protein
VQKNNGALPFTPRAKATTANKNKILFNTNSLSNFGFGGASNDDNTVLLHDARRSSGINSGIPSRRSSLGADLEDILNGSKKSSKRNSPNGGKKNKNGKALLGPEFEAKLNLLTSQKSKGSRDNSEPNTRPSSREGYRGRNESFDSRPSSRNALLRSDTPSTVLSIPEHRPISKSEKKNILSQLSRPGSTAHSRKSSMDLNNLTSALSGVNKRKSSTKLVNKERDSLLAAISRTSSKPVSRTHSRQPSKEIDFSSLMESGSMDMSQVKPPTGLRKQPEHGKLTAPKPKAMKPNIPKPKTSGKTSLTSALSSHSSGLTAQKKRAKPSRADAKTSSLLDKIQSLDSRK